MIDMSRHDPAQFEAGEANRWGGRRRQPFDAKSDRHVSVYGR
jgi:hypothetical protein